MSSRSSGSLRGSLCPQAVFRAAQPEERIVQLSRKYDAVDLSLSLSLSLFRSLSARLNLLHRCDENDLSVVLIRRGRIVSVLRLRQRQHTIDHDFEPPVPNLRQHGSPHQLLDETTTISTYIRV